MFSNKNKRFGINFGKTYRISLRTYRIGGKMMDVKDCIAELNPDAIFIDGLDEAIVGHIDRNDVIVALYDIEKCVSAFMRLKEIDREEALEDLYFNVFQAYLGINTPAFATLFSE